MPLSLPTFDALYDIGKSEIQSRDVTLTDFNDGSNLDAITGAGSALADETIRIGVSYFAATFLDTAEDDDLDDVIADRFPAMVARNAAAAAVVPLIFTRGGSTGVLEIPATTEIRAVVNGRTVTFRTDTTTYMAAIDSTVSVDATCTVTGITGNIAAATLTTIPTALVGDATATVTNAVRAAGGAPVETDDQLRDRARRYHGTLRKGTVGALEAAAVAVPGVSFATVDESKMAPELGGYVAIYVGDPDARGNTALAADVEAVIDETRAAGVDVRVFASAREEFSLAATLYVVAGADLTSIQAAAHAAILAYGDNLAPNATYYLSQVEAAACGITDVLGCEVTSPLIDQVPTEDYNALRVVSGSLTLTLTEA